MKSKILVVIWSFMAAFHVNAQEIEIDIEDSPKRIKQFIENNKFGFKDENDSILIEALYDKLPSYYANIMVAQKKGLYGVIKSNGEIAISFIYDQIMKTNFNKKYNEKLIKYVCRKEGLHSFFNNKGERLLEDEFHEVQFLKRIRYDGIIVIKNGLKGIIDPTGNIIVPLQFQELTIRFLTRHNIAKGLDKVPAIKGTKTGFYSLLNKEWVEIDYKSVLSYDENHIVLQNKDYKYGIVSANNLRITVPLEYSHFRPLKKNPELILCKGGDSFGIIDYYGKVIIPFIYNSIQEKGQNFLVKLDRKYGLIDVNNRIIIPIDHDVCGNLISGEYYFKKDNLIGFYDTKGNRLTDFIFVKKESNRPVAHTQDGKQYIYCLKSDGNYIMTLYDDVHMFNGHFLPILRHGNLELIGLVEYVDKQLELRVEPKYIKIERMSIYTQEIERIKIPNEVKGLAVGTLPNGDIELITNSKKQVHLK